ncbi:hypothetical protein VNO77_44856 [Canavalia gladiata]|uniref:Uncharacterized protein n=1 Tax=Canavalia gladiata TaxID=3824 RepID=A0AAN9JYU9_CANGL
MWPNPMLMHVLCPAWFVDLIMINVALKGKVACEVQREVLEDARGTSTIRPSTSFPNLVILEPLPAIPKFPLKVALLVTIWTIVAFESVASKVLSLVWHE